MLDRYDRLALIGSLRDIDVKDCNHGALYPNVCILVYTFHISLELSLGGLYSRVVMVSD